MAIASPLVAQNDQGEFIFGSSIVKEALAKMSKPSFGQISRSGHSPKPQEHNVLRLVDAMTNAFEDRRRKREGKKGMPPQISMANKADIKPLAYAVVARPGWSVADQRSVPALSFIQA